MAHYFVLLGILVYLIYKWETRVPRPPIRARITIEEDVLPQTKDLNGSSSVELVDEQFSNDLQAKKFDVTYKRLTRGILPVLRLKYTNTREQTYYRLIEPYRKGANIDYFQAFCHEENARRSFRFDRVEHAIDMNTGEILSSYKLFKLIHPTRD